MRKLILLVSILTLVSYSQDLFDARGEIFTDNRPLAVGTVITITFDDQLVLNYQAQLVRQANKNFTSSEIQSEIFNFFPKLDFSGKSGDQNSTKLQATKGLKGSLAGQIQAFDPTSSTYRIAASQTMLINGKTDSVQLTGVVSLRDLSHDHVVSSRKVANPFITYAGYAIGKDKVVNEKDLNNFEFKAPSNASNQKAGVQLSEPKKKELFLEYFNQLLNELF